MKYNREWEMKVIHFLTDNGNILRKFNHDNERLYFKTQYHDYTSVTYEQLEKTMKKMKEEQYYGNV